MAVYTILNREEIINILSYYNVKLLDFKRIKEGILNTSYEIKTKDRDYILRISESNRNFNEEKLELNFITDIKDIIPVPRIKKTKDNKNYLIYKDKFITLFEKIIGSEIISVNENYIEQIAIYLGKMHAFSQNKKIDRVSRINYKNYINKINLDIPKIHKMKIKNAENSLKNIDFSHLPIGIIHNDIFPDNVLEKDKKIKAIIDFNECCTNFLLVDIAVVINFWIRIKDFTKCKKEHLINLFLSKYSEFRPITSDEIKLLDMMMIKVSLDFIYLRLYQNLKNSHKNVTIKNKSYIELISLI